MFYIYYITSIILIEIFDPFETEFICNPIILVCLNDLFGRKKVVAILIFQMILTYNNNKWRYRPTVRINTLNYNNLFLIARLYNFNFLISIVRCYNKSGYNLVYKKAGLIEIPNIAFYNIIFNNYILEKSKPNPNYF